MSFSDCVKRYAEISGRTQGESKVICNEILAMITEALVNDEPIEIYGFGTLAIYKTAPREMRGVDGKTHQVGERRSIRFKMGRMLKAKLNPGD